MKHVVLSNWDIVTILISVGVPAFIILVLLWNDRTGVLTRLLNSIFSRQHDIDDDDDDTDSAAHVMI